MESERKKIKVKRNSNKTNISKSAYMFYTEERRTQIQNELQNEQKPLLDLADLTRKIADEWKNMAPTQQKKYVDMAIQDKARYREEMRFQNQWKKN